MFTRIPGTHLEDSENWYHIEIPGDIEEDSGECLKVFQGMFKKIPKILKIFLGINVRKILGIFKKIPGIDQKDFREWSRRIERI